RKATTPNTCTRSHKSLGTDTVGRTRIRQRLRQVPRSSPLCPRSLECALAGRHFCRPGSSHCGPCLRPLVENSRGRCVVKRRHAPHTHSVKGRCSYLILLRLFSQDDQNVLIMSYSNVCRPANTSIIHAVCWFLLSVMSSVVIVAGSLALLVALACWVLHKPKGPHYPSQEWTGWPALGDKKLAHSAQMYHYQHQKQQMLSLRKVEPKVPDSAASTDEENEDGDFTVYECPGLAPTGEMEVKNPLFDDSTLYLQRFHK
uniref:Neural proliferation, differentiation and control, 1b n=1 Tax=Pundamilia nyererei TaxID=303518 RepID=A0A3B4FFI1_9CICH